MGIMTVAAYKLRTVIILGLLTLWAAGAAFKLYAHTVRDRDRLLAQARAIAWREAVIPARRGTIRDRTGAILAQDVFRCDLVLESLPKSPRRTAVLFRRLRETLPELKTDPAGPTFPVLLKERLAAGEIQRYSQIFRRFPEVRVTGRFERQFHPDPAVAALVGEIALNDRGERVGVSGLEQRNDLTLSGKPGRIVVMLDRYGSWIYETLRVVRQPENGRDLDLDRSLAELTAPQPAPAAPAPGGQP